MVILSYAISSGVSGVIFNNYNIYFISSDDKFYYFSEILICEREISSL